MLRRKKNELDNLILKCCDVQKVIDFDEIAR